LGKPPNLRATMSVDVWGCCWGAKLEHASHQSGHSLLHNKVSVMVSSMAEAEENSELHSSDSNQASRASQTVQHTRQNSSALSRSCLNDNSGTAASRAWMELQWHSVRHLFTWRREVTLT
jgi:hypothetical protein